MVAVRQGCLLGFRVLGLGFTVGFRVIIDGQFGGCKWGYKPCHHEQPTRGKWMFQRDFGVSGAPMRILEG